MEIISILKAETACECLVSFCSPVSSYHSLLMMAKECGKICCEKTHHQIEKVEEKWRRWQWRDKEYRIQRNTTASRRRSLHDFIVDPLVLSLISFQVKTCFISFLVFFLFLSFLLFHRPSPHSSFYSSLVSFHISDSERLFLDSSSSLHCVLYTENTQRVRHIRRVCPDALYLREWKSWDVAVVVLLWFKRKVQESNDKCVKRKSRGSRRRCKIVWVFLVGLVYSVSLLFARIVSDDDEDVVIIEVLKKAGHRVHSTSTRE